MNDKICFMLPVTMLDQYEYTPFVKESNAEGKPQTPPKTLNIPLERLAKYFPNRSEAEMTEMIFKILDTWHHHIQHDCLHLRSIVHNIVDNGIDNKLSLVTSLRVQRFDRGHVHGITRIEINVETVICFLIHAYFR